MFRNLIGQLLTNQSSKSSVDRLVNRLFDRDQRDSLTA